MSAHELHHLIGGLTDVDLYERGRAEYPPELVATLRERLGLGPGSRVADLGAGSGKLSRVLAAGGLDVVGVEPLPAMREVLARDLGPERTLDGTAEAIPLPDGSVDAVTSGDAFHWFDGARAVSEIHRVLAPGGGVAIVWRVPDASRTQPWMAEIERIVAAVRPEHPGFTQDRGMDKLDEHGGFTARERVDIPFDHVTTRAGILDGVASITFVGLLPESERRALLDSCAEVLETVPGDVLHSPLMCETWLSRRLP